MMDLGEEWLMMDLGEEWLMMALGEEWQMMGLAEEWQQMLVLAEVRHKLHDEAFKLHQIWRSTCAYIVGEMKQILFFFWTNKQMLWVWAAFKVKLMRVASA